MTFGAFCIFTVLSILAGFVAENHTSLFVCYWTGMRKWTSRVAAADRKSAQGFGGGFLGDWSSRGGFGYDRRDRMGTKFCPLGDFNRSFLCSIACDRFLLLPSARSYGRLTSAIFCIISPICAIFDCIIIICAIISCCWGKNPNPPGCI